MKKALAVCVYAQKKRKPRKLKRGPNAIFKPALSVEDSNFRNYYYHQAVKHKDKDAVDKLMKLFQYLEKCFVQEKFY